MGSSNRKQIKEYVYFDKQEVDSILSQLKNGIPKLMKKIKANYIGKQRLFKNEP